MKRIRPTLSVLFAALCLAGCGEEFENELAGEWSLTGIEYVITPGESFEFHNIFGQPWLGKVRINEKEIEGSKFNYAFDNVWGNEILYTAEVHIRPIHSEYLEFDSENIVYQFKEKYVLDLTGGIFKAEGTATAHNGETLAFKIDLVIPAVEMQKGEEAAIKDGYYSMPYKKLNFSRGGKLQTEYLVGDIMNQLAGKWSIQSSQLRLSTEYDKNDLYDFLVGGQSLVLYRECNMNNLPQFVKLFGDKIEKVVYRATYKPS